MENRATVDSVETEPENSNTVTTTVAPDLVIQKLDDPDPVRTEGLLLYTLRVTNEGQSNATDFVIVDDLPLDEVDLVRLASEDFECEVNGDRVRCTGSLPAGETGTVEIVVEAEEEGTIQNTAAVRADGILVDTDTEFTRVEARNNGGTNTGPGTTISGPGTTTGTHADETTAQGTTNAETTTADEADVITDTIPDRKLPFTGGMPLLGLAAIGLASLVAGASVLRAVTRRRG
jgi:uncharacterized repeat protein (TIGR01451 family)